MSGEQCPCSGSGPKSSDFGSVATSGVQDVAALLPLLGTEQCALHVTSALDRGLLYVAGTPMSIFGSLGIVKAGFVTLWASIDVGFFHGPRQLRNAGFQPTGALEMLAYAFDLTDSIYVAEDRLRIALNQTSGGVSVNRFSRHWLSWNATMVISTLLLSGFGLLPYVHLIVRDTPERVFRSTWMYPILRVLGSAVTGIMIQLVLQLRILVILHNRLRFMAINDCIRNGGKIPPEFWNPDIRSEVCLSMLKTHRRSSTSSFLDDVDVDVMDVGSFVSFTMHRRNSRSSDMLSYITHLLFPVLLLAFFRSMLVLGMICSVVGYIGCFSLIQASANNRGPLIWLILETAICILRLFVWAANPRWDDAPPPITMEKEYGPQETITYQLGWRVDGVTADDMHILIIGIDKYLSPSIPQLIASVSDATKLYNYFQRDLRVPKHQISFLANENATADKVTEAFRSLADNSTIKPDAPIVIYVAAHTVSNSSIGDFQGGSNLHAIGREALPDVGNARRKTQELVPTGVTLVTHDFQYNDNIGLPYATILSLLEEIAKRSENIAVILDTCHSANLGVNSKFDTTDTNKELMVGYPSHVLLASCSPNESSLEDTEGGIFTTVLVEELKKADGDKITYKELHKRIISSFMSRSLAQNPQCSGASQSKLVFNGLCTEGKRRRSHQNP